MAPFIGAGGLPNHVRRDPTPCIRDRSPMQPGQVRGRWIKEFRSADPDR
jgi:hypothetical protein